jgi:Yip1 domain
MTFRQRAIGAAKLDIAVFEEIEADRHATRQALVVVVLSSAAAGVGLSSSVYDAPVLTRVILALLLWLFWAALTYAIGRYLLPEPQTETDVGELLRTIGFAASPGILRIFGFIPGVGPTLYGVATVWMLVAMIIAVRQALDYKSTARAVVVCLIAWVIAVAMAALIGGLLFVVAEEMFS